MFCPLKKVGCGIFLLIFNLSRQPPAGFSYLVLSKWLIVSIFTL
ncbi:MAG: hypothetical protein AVDCRST_MAG95-3281 [uncultured Adhaeribacter sp.]|uniref:Uncharacterized protein n=1 Tax=uncultured Adhaeribacter sp. TaxID=448109 RepID=A0A6J4JKI1_9BACT|nr:MAG: hypothetical protein AVDCRST_MAG95-3281 [uncultured Adhaeribacter sp.]